MPTINTIEEFWNVVNDIRIEKELNWTDLVGKNAKLAISKKWNLTLNSMIQIQKKLDITLLHTVTYEGLESDYLIHKNPESPMKMALIYQLIQSEDWMQDEATVQKVQKIATTIIQTKLTRWLTRIELSKEIDKINV